MSHGDVYTPQIVLVVDAALMGNTVGLKAWHALREAFREQRPMTLREFEAWSENLETLVADASGGLVVSLRGTA